MLSPSIEKRKCSCPLSFNRTCAEGFARAGLVGALALESDCFVTVEDWPMMDPTIGAWSDSVGGVDHVGGGGFTSAGGSTGLGGVGGWPSSLPVRSGNIGPPSTIREIMYFLAEFMLFSPSHS